MNNTYINTIIKEGKATQRVMTIILLLLFAILLLQSRVFHSNLWELLKFSHYVWWKNLRQILQILVIWAGLTGVIFALNFASNPLNNSFKRVLTGVIVGFINGFAFNYFLVFALGIFIFIPLALLSFFFEDIIEYATLEFAWVSAGYIIFIWIALDTPSFLLEGIKHGKWSVKLLAVGLMLALGVHLLSVITNIFKIIFESSRWIYGDDVLVMVFGSLVVTIIAILKIAGFMPFQNLAFSVLGVYIASIATGNLTQVIFRWGGIPAELIAVFVGPIVYSMAVKAILQTGFVAAFGMVGAFAGTLAGLLIAQIAKMKIIGEGWFGILCGTSIAIGFGVAFGGMWAETLVKILMSNTRLKPEIAINTGIGLFVGIIIGIVLGGFIGR
jgi:hypothetical protein